MKKTREYVILGVILVLLLGMIGTAIRTAPATNSARFAGPAVIMRVLDPSLEVYAPMWKKEVERRFNHATVLLVHGGDFVEGQWIVGDLTYRNGPHVRPIQDAVREAIAADPSRTVVVLACNPGHLSLGIPGVYYSHSNVWCVPDRSIADEGVALSALDDKLWFGKKPTPAPAPKLVIPNRWEIDPDVIGNIFEFTAE